MLAYRTTTGSAPTYFHSLLRIYIPSRSPAYFHSLLRIYIPSRSPAYFHSLLRIYIPSRSPAYFHSLLRIYIPSRSLRSASERRLVVPSQRGSQSLSRTFSFTVPGCWNDISKHTCSIKLILILIIIRTTVEFHLIIIHNSLSWKICFIMPELSKL